MIKKFLISLAALLIVTGLWAQTPAEDYSLKFQFTLGPSMVVTTDTKGTDWPTSLGGYADFTIPVSKRFSFRTYGYANWNTIRNAYGPGEDQNFTNAVLDVDLRFCFNPSSKYQAYVLGGLETYWGSWNNVPDSSFTKLTYSIGGGGYFYFNGTKFVINPELRWAPETDTWTVRVKSDVAIWKDRVFLSPEVKWSNIDVDYYAGTGTSVKFHTDNYALGIGLTFKF